MASAAVVMLPMPTEYVKRVAPILNWTKFKAWKWRTEFAHGRVSPRALTSTAPDFAVHRAAAVSARGYNCGSPALSSARLAAALGQSRDNQDPSRLTKLAIAADFGVVDWDSIPAALPSYAPPSADAETTASRVGVAGRARLTLKIAQRFGAGSAWI
jgi:hypothetical protein